jgi:hypothetical protein
MNDSRTLHIQAATPSTYIVTYAPGSEGAGALKQQTVQGDEDLHSLLGQLGLPRDMNEHVLEELREKGQVSIPLALTDEQLSRHGLRWTIGDKILSYLSALNR